MLKLRRAGKAQSRAVTSDFILKSRFSAISDWPASALLSAQYKMIFTPLEIRFHNNSGEV
jgi:hypothetical protein